MVSRSRHIPSRFITRVEATLSGSQILTTLSKPRVSNPKCKATLPPSVARRPDQVATQSLLTASLQEERSVPRGRCSRSTDRASIHRSPLAPTSYSLLLDPLEEEAFGLRRGEATTDREMPYLRFGEQLNEGFEIVDAPTPELHSGCQKLKSHQSILAPIGSGCAAQTSTRHFQAFGYTPPGHECGSITRHIGGHGRASPATVHSVSGHEPIGESPRAAEL